MVQPDPLPDLDAGVTLLRSGGRGALAALVPAELDRALTTYFGKVASADEYRLRGVEARQRSTLAFVEECQREWLRVLDRAGPDAVLDRLRRDVNELRAGTSTPRPSW